MELKISSFNMRGLNYGAGALKELCKDNTIICLQELWLRDEELERVSILCPDFNHFSVSAMTNRLSQGLYRGRPYQGVSILWHK